MGKNMKIQQKKVEDSGKRKGKQNKESKQRKQKKKVKETEKDGNDKKDWNDKLWGFIGKTISADIFDLTLKWTCMLDETCWWHTQYKLSSKIAPTFIQHFVQYVGWNVGSV